MSIAEELVKVLPEEWKSEASSDTHIHIPYPPTGKFTDSLTLTDTQESPWFINWALDELAKRCYGVCLEWCGEWRVRLVKHRHTNEIVQGVHPTKTLALAHALIALGENDE